MVEDALLMATVWRTQKRLLAAEFRVDFQLSTRISRQPGDLVSHFTSPHATALDTVLSIWRV